MNDQKSSWPMQKLERKKNQFCTNHQSRKALYSHKRVHLLHNISTSKWGN